jgi:tetratricopeptide (TPR) repeat protein
MGLKLFHSGEYHVALEYFKNSIAAMPDNAEAYYYLGYSYQYIGNISAAGQSFLKGLKADKNNVKIMAALASHYTDIGEYKKAEVLLDKAIRTSPNYPETYNNRGVLFFRKGNYRAALENYNIAIRLDSSFALAYSNRGTVRYYYQDVEKASKADIRLAIKDFNKALELEPYLDVALKNRANAYRLLGEKDSSLADYERYIQNNPKNYSGYLGRGKLKLETKQYKNAIEDFMIALEYKPDEAEVYYEMANAKSKLNYYNEAIDDLIKAMAYDAWFTGNCLYKIAANYSLMNEKAKAMAFLNRCAATKFFENRKQYEAFINDNDFDNLKNEKQFIAFKERLKRKVK